MSSCLLILPPFCIKSKTIPFPLTPAQWQWQVMVYYLRDVLQHDTYNGGMQIICHLRDSPIFSLVTTFNLLLLLHLSNSFSISTERAGCLCVTVIWSLPPRTACGGGGGGFNDIFIPTLKGHSLKVLTDHSNWEASLGSFDPQWQNGGSAIFFMSF